MSAIRFRAGVPRTDAHAKVAGIPAFFFALLLLAGCERITPMPKGPPDAPAVAPSAAELYVFPHGRLSMSAFEALRAAYPRVSAADVARIARYAQWIRSRFPPDQGPSLQETTRCVRALFAPKPPPKEFANADACVRERLGFASLDSLRESGLDAERGWVVDWNPSLAREYGIPVAKP